MAPNQVVLNLLSARRLRITYSSISRLPACLFGLAISRQGFRNSFLSLRLSSHPIYKPVTLFCSALPDGSNMADEFIYYIDDYNKEWLKEWLDKNNEQARGEGTHDQT